MAGGHSPALPGKNGNSECWLGVPSGPPLKSRQCLYCYPHFLDEATEVQGREMNYTSLLSIVCLNGFEQTGVENPQLRFEIQCHENRIPEM